MNLPQEAFGWAVLTCQWPAVSMQRHVASGLVQGCLQGLGRASWSEVGRAEAGWVVLGAGPLAFSVAISVLWASPSPLCPSCSPRDQHVPLEGKL